MIPRRMTIQKKNILEYLRSVKSHPTAEMVYNNVKHEVPKITLATVYRNLNQLADDKIILKLEVNGEFRFDGDLSHHQHCICKGCGKIIDLFQPEISKSALNNIQTNNFTPDGVKVIFTGLCSECN